MGRRKQISLEAKQIVECAMVITSHLAPGDAALAFMEASGEIQGRATSAMKSAQTAVKPNLRLLELTETANGDNLLPLEDSPTGAGGGA